MNNCATQDREKLRQEAIAEGFKDETCAKCGTLFEAHIHFVRCDADDCPMKSTKDTRTILERFRDAATTDNSGSGAKP